MGLCGGGAIGGCNKAASVNVMAGCYSSVSQSVHNCFSSSSATVAIQATTS